ncbi:MAG: recombination-associated protein RdgC [Lentisphaeria bacterium]|nr:recombination-associated protein RdgC [Lentisphaeria bacterium]
MGFDNGSVTFSIFELNGELPADAVELFAARKAGTLDSVSSDPEAEPQVGWVTGRHLLDNVIDDVSIHCGTWLHVAMRTACRKLPASLLQAFCRREEQAYLEVNHADFVPGKKRREIRESVIARYLPMMTPSLSALPVLIDPAAGEMYLGTGSPAKIESFTDFFYSTLGVDFVQWTPATMLDRFFQTTEAAFPAIRFADVPGDGEPVIGRDFLTWLWYYSETTGKITTEDGEFDLLIEGPLTLVDASEANGAEETVIRKGNSPQRSAEAKSALATGKKLKKAKFSLTRDPEIWSGTFDADTFSFSSVKLPEGEAMESFDRFRERQEFLQIFKGAMEAYFKVFAGTFLKGDADKAMKQLQEWAAGRDAI